MVMRRGTGTGRRTVVFQPARRGAQRRLDRAHIHQHMVEACDSRAAFRAGAADFFVG